MNFVQDYPLEKLKPADYNPRKLAEEAFENLKESLCKFGVVKPIILNGANGILTAGHQRTKTMKAIGMKTAPAIILRDISLKDEIRFNLFHNTIETNQSAIKIKNPKDLNFGYSFVKQGNVEILKRDNAVIVAEIAKLIAKYGPWGSVIIDEDGNVIENSDYAAALSSFNEDLLVYKMENSKVEEFLKYMKINYGEYHYEALGIKAYNQVFCQKHRLETTDGREATKSVLYETLVLKNLKSSDRLVDFGAGECAYVKMLKKKRIKAYAYEPHYRKEGKNSIDISQVVQFINILNRDMKNNGLYNVVVLDSVLNSITNLEFEDYVLTACNALCREDGTFFTSTRNLTYINEYRNISISRDSYVRYIEFLDKDNFSATFRNGVWTLQKFNTAEDLRNLLEKYFEEVTIKNVKGKTIEKGKEAKFGTSILGIGRKPRKLSKEKYEKALDVEFNMEYPNDFRHNKHEDLVKKIVELVMER